MAVALQVRVAEIIGEDEHDIGLLRRGGGRESAEGECKDGDGKVEKSGRISRLVTGP
jgi:hypothetical protein